MNDRLYDMMDWGVIEGFVYAEIDQPHTYLGAHETQQGVLVQVFVPTAKEAAVVARPSGKVYKMELADENGFFAVLLPLKKVPDYYLKLTFDDGSEKEIEDPYRFAPVITQKDTDKFAAGICYNIYEKMGAHPVTVDGVKGVSFAVWAPEALRVSVVGDFNLWDGRRHPMRRLGNTGIFELFIPGIPEGAIYKFEIRAKGGATFLKADPYANAAQLRPENASVVANLSGFEWSDQKWMEKRAYFDASSAPVYVYELHLGAFKKPEDGRPFYNYRELAPMVAEYVKKMGYTHIELMPVMEHPLDESWGYQTSGYYAPTSRYGNPKDFMCFVNYMHAQGIGVIMDWTPAYFCPDDFAMRGFDGSCLYEHYDQRQSVHPQLGTLYYNYGRPEVSNFLIANALFWTKVYHADGLRLDSMSSMLFLDYGKQDGQWIANMYGGNENLQAVEFLKHLSSVLHKENRGIILAAQEVWAWPAVTTSLADGGLGFDLKWNEGWKEDFISYMQLDPIFRGRHHGELTFSMIYQYSEKYALALSHDEFVYDKGSLLMHLPGKPENKIANLKAVLGYLTAHPGKKLLFMGQDLGIRREVTVSEGIRWSEAQDEARNELEHYQQELVRLYKSYPALYKLDNDPDGFEWINDISANENMLVFLRKSENEKDMLMVVCNFSALTYENHKIGVPFPGKYKEIFNSDKEEFGGKGNINPRLKNAKKDECDGRAYSVRITVPPMGISVFTCTRVDKPVSENEEARTGKKKAEEASSPAKAVKKKISSLKETLSKKIQEEEHK